MAISRGILKFKVKCLHVSESIYEYVFSCLVQQSDHTSLSFTVKWLQCLNRIDLLTITEASFIQNYMPLFTNVKYYLILFCFIATKVK